ncbi:acetolactate decarboxylase [Longimicrobium sp.]|uniref:acetolactate decarboxylase n=1 Tax=Longimicrobium sp. TaxID=2029185 RepID=UPI002E37BBAE|nr:acetolactate decarboxylase [Longimicrobium sp.]HEX6038084.1 acetolactate decarboxylase [Longimicrobium sp.]
MIRRIPCAAALLAAGTLACSNPAPPAPGPSASDPARTVWQLSPFALLQAGGYDGLMTVDEVRRHGDLGLAAADELNGEMVMVDGRLYQFLADGRVAEAPGSMRLPFAEVTRWTGGRDIPVAAGQTYGASGMPGMGTLPAGADAFYALRLEGTWDTVVVRTFHQQSRPYPPLDSAVHHQAVDTLINVRGTMAGFWQPAFAKGLSIPGYHLHVLSDDRAKGGHVLSFRAGNVRMQVAERPEFIVHLPPDAIRDVRH